MLLVVLMLYACAIINAQNGATSFSSSFLDTKYTSSNCGTAIYTLGYVVSKCIANGGGTSNTYTCSNTNTPTDYAYTTSTCSSSFMSSMTTLNTLCQR